MQANPVVWFEIYVSDMERAKAFYETVLAVKLIAMDAPTMEGPPMRMEFFPGQPDRAGACGALVKMEGVPVGGGSTLVYFACEDCAVEAGRAAAAGGKLFKPKMSISPYGFFALVTDTEGNMIGLHSMK